MGNGEWGRVSTTPEKVPHKHILTGSVDGPTACTGLLYGREEAPEVRRPAIRIPNCVRIYTYGEEQTLHLSANQVLLYTQVTDSPGRGNTRGSIFLSVRIG